MNMNNNMEDILNLLGNAANDKAENSKNFVADELVNVLDSIKEKEALIETLKNNLKSNEENYNKNVSNIEVYYDLFDEQAKIEEENRLKELISLDAEIKNCNNNINDIQPELLNLRREQFSITERIEKLKGRPGDSSKEIQKLRLRAAVVASEIEIYNNMIVGYKNTIKEKKDNIKRHSAEVDFSRELVKNSKVEYENYKTGRALNDFSFDSAEIENQIFDLEHEISDLKVREEALSYEPSVEVNLIKEMIIKKEDPTLIKEKLDKLVNYIDNNVVVGTVGLEKVEYETNEQLIDKVKTFVKLKEEEIASKEYLDSFRKDGDIAEKEVLTASIKNQQERVNTLNEWILADDKFEKLDFVNAEIEKHSENIQKINREIAMYSATASQQDLDNYKILLEESRTKSVELRKQAMETQIYIEQQGLVRSNDKSYLQLQKEKYENDIREKQDRLVVINERIEKNDYLDVVSKNNDQKELMDAKNQLLVLEERQNKLNNNNPKELVGKLMMEYSVSLSDSKDNIVLQDAKVDKIEIQPMNTPLIEKKSEPLGISGPVLETEKETKNDNLEDLEELEIIDEYTAKDKILNFIRRLKANKELIAIAFATAATVVLASFGMQKEAEAAVVDEPTVAESFYETEDSLIESSQKIDEIGDTQLEKISAEVEKNSFIDSMMVSDNADNYYLAELMQEGKLSSSADAAINHEYAENVATRDQIPEEIMVLGIYYMDEENVVGPIGVMPKDADQSKVAISVGTKESSGYTVTGYISVSDILDKENTAQMSNETSKGL